MHSIFSIFVFIIHGVRKVCNPAIRLPVLIEKTNGFLFSLFSLRQVFAVLLRILRQYNHRQAHLGRKLIEKEKCLNTDPGATYYALPYQERRRVNLVGGTCMSV